ncbi:MAG TPA: hypothetical protein VHV83_14725, partial [Armatimonadota bacterium]|nr:hypothetical protein [Armatimonadota bacterium]
QLTILEEHGADLRRFIVGHCSDTDDVAYLESLLARGCFLGFDRIQPNADHHRAQARTICTLLEHGWLDKLLLSHDYCTFIDFRNNSWADTKARGCADLPVDYTYIHRNFLPILRQMGVTQEQILHMLRINTAKIFAA